MLDRHLLKGQPLQNLVDHAVVHRFLRGHELVAVGVLFDPFERLSRVVQKDFIEIDQRPEFGRIEPCLLRSIDV